MKSTKPLFAAGIAAFCALAVGLTLLITTPTGTVSTQPAAPEPSVTPGDQTANPLQAIPYVIAACDAYTQARYTLLTASTTDKSSALDLFTTARADATLASGFDENYTRLMELLSFTDTPDYDSFAADARDLSGYGFDFRPEEFTAIDDICQTVFISELTGSELTQLGCVYATEARLLAPIRDSIVTESALSDASSALVRAMEAENLRTDVDDMFTAVRTGDVPEQTRLATSIATQCETIMTGGTA